MRKILFILLLPFLCNAQSQVQRASDGSLIFVPQMSTGTYSTNNIPVYNGSTWTPSTPAIVGALTNYWVKDGSDNLSYSLGTNVIYNSAASTPRLGIAGANYVALNATNNRTLTNGLSQSQFTLTNGTTYFGASDRTWQILNLYDGTNSNLRFQHWNGSSYIQTFTNWGTGRITIGPTGSVDAGQLFQVNGSTMLGNSGSAVTNYVVRLQATGGSSDIFRTTVDPNSAITGNPSDLVLLSAGGNGSLYGKYSGSATNTGWGKFLNLIDPNGASSGQVLSWNGSTWIPTTSLGSTSWQLIGNSVTAGTQFLGSTNNVSLRFRTNNIQRAMIDSTGNVGIAITPIYQLDVGGTNAIRVPVGNTAQRPTGARGLIRYNLQTWKYEGIRHGTAYERFFMLEDTLGATAGQVLTYNSGVWAPATNTSESTKIGVFSNSTDLKGLTLSGDSIKLMSASLTRPGAINLIAQSFSAGAGSKLFQSSSTASILVDNSADTGEAGIGFTQLSGADNLGYIQVNSTDSDNARMQFLVEEGGGSYDTKLLLGTLNDEKGVYQGSGLYEDVTTVTSGPYTVVYGDRNIYLDGASITVNLQAIGTSTAETKIGRILYFFNDNATNVTLTPNGAETINDSATLVIPANTGVTLLAVTGTKWVTRD